MIGILLASYGSPSNLDEIPQYLTNIRKGHKPSTQDIEELKQKYILIGGTSPLYEITRNQAQELAKLLNKPVYFGFKHSKPFLWETLDKMNQNGYKSVLVIVLAPHYSILSIGEYMKTINANNINVHFVKNWHLEDMLIETWTDLISDALTNLPQNKKENLMYIFTAHSLPAKIIQWNDPYPTQLMETTLAIVNKLNIKNWTFCYQSASKTPENWLKPDLLETIEKLTKEKYTNFLVCPIGFVADNLEILYDIDIEAKNKAKKLNAHLSRTKMPNTHPKFIKALANVARKELSNLLEKTNEQK